MGEWDFSSSFIWRPLGHELHIPSHSSIASSANKFVPITALLMGTSDSQTTRSRGGGGGTEAEGVGETLKNSNSFFVPHNRIAKRSREHVSSWVWTRGPPLLTFGTCLLVSWRVLRRDYFVISSSCSTPWSVTGKETLSPKNDFQRLNSSTWAHSREEGKLETPSRWYQKKRMRRRRRVPIEPPEGVEGTTKLFLPLNMK